jgi:eukaryotic-like serine/threonine-protein kinase
VACPSEDTALLFVRGQLDASEARQVEVHVDACERCYSTLTELARAFGSTLAIRSALDKESGVRHRAPPPAPATESEGIAVGGKFGRYTIQGQLGEGGMGRVYLAYDTVLSRPVALKLLRAGAVPSSEREEFALREARAIAQLSHPNVVAVYDAGIEAGQLYIAMEYVPGQSLSAWLAASKRQPWEVSGILHQAAQGLSALHDAGLVHRDVKPDNILIGAEGRVRITDFGLAQFGAADQGLFAGTPAYMSPEQLFMRPTDPRADQFSFALVVCEAVAQFRPFPGRTLDELKWSIAGTRPIFPPSLSQPVRDVLARALNLHPEGRFPSIRDFLRALDDAFDARHLVHFKLNVAFLVVMGIIHLGVVLWSILRPDSAPSPPSTPSSSGGSSGLAWYEVLFGGVFVLFLLLATLWTVLGIAWAPINAWAIATKKRWARASTIIYACFGLFTCIGTPYSAYALISLRKPEMKRALEG